MRHLAYHAVLAAAALALLALGGATAQEGALRQTIPPAVSQQPAIPQLQLSDDQREKIREALSKEDTEVTFSVKETKSAQGFNPKVGATIPKALKPHPLPRPLIYQMPLLRRYTYLKLKHQVVIVNPLSRKVVAMVPEA
jgi:hypothetical protein